MRVSANTNRVNLFLIMFSLVTVLGEFKFQYCLRVANVFAKSNHGFNTQSLTALRQDVVLCDVESTNVSPLMLSEKMNVSLILAKETCKKHGNGLT